MSICQKSGGMWNEYWITLPRPRFATTPNASRSCPPPAVDETLSEVSAVLDLDVLTLDTPEALQSVISVHSDGRRCHCKSTSTEWSSTVGCRGTFGRSILGGSCSRFAIARRCSTTGTFAGGTNRTDVSDWIRFVRDHWAQRSAGRQVSRCYKHEGTPRIRGEHQRTKTDRHRRLR